MEINLVSVQGTNEWNEDALIVNEAMQVYGVADGATSLVPYRSSEGKTGGKRASEVVKNHFENYVESDSRVLLEELMIGANKSLGKAMQMENIDVSEKANVWTTGVAVVRINANTIEYAQTGDCMILAMYNDQSFRVVTRDQLAYFDNRSKKAWKKAIEEGLQTQKEIRSVVEPLIREQKSIINTMSGYSVLDGSEEATLFLESGKINRINLTDVIICSDGLFMHEETNATVETDPMKELVKYVSLIGIENYVNYLNSIEANDPECLRFPRTKKSDDKTAIHIKL